VAGAPVSDVARLEAVADEFAAHAHSQSCSVCYFGAGDRLETVYTRSSAWSRVLLGAQPSWDPQRWRDAIAPRSSIRAQFNRARNKGVVITEWAPADAENHPALRRCLAEWLATRHLPPLHFLVEPETLNRLEDRRVFVATSVDREVLAFTVLSPIPARNGWLVEQIVRGRRAPNGTAELLIDAAVRAVGDAGAAYVTLGLSPLSSRAGSTVSGQPLWLRFALQWVRLHGARFYNFGGLDSFKAKFNPEIWEPIYAIAEGERFPPRALYAIAGAFSGGKPIRLVLTALTGAALRELRSGRASINSAVSREKLSHPEPRS
jgi:phosphatidylglycerol lysyltransferase